MGVALENARLFAETQRLLEETRQRASELGVINRIQEGLASKLDTQAIIDLVGDKVTEIFGSARWSVSDQAAGCFLPLVSPAPAGGRGGASGEGLVRSFCGQPLLFSTGGAVAGGISALLHGPAGKQVESILAVPMITGDQATGAISVQSYSPHAYNEGHIRLLSTLTASMGVSLQNAHLFAETERLLEESRQSAAELAIINSVSEAMSSQLDVGAIIRTVGDQVPGQLQAETATIQLYDPRNQPDQFPLHVRPRLCHIPADPLWQGTDHDGDPDTPAAAPDDA
jgi:GAF domain-containing protein